MSVLAFAISTKTINLHQVDKHIGLNILSLFHYRRRVRIVTCETLEEAMKALTD